MSACSRAALARLGFFRRADVIERYARQSGRDVAATEFYQVLALYKLAIIAEGLYARYLQGKTLAGFEDMSRSAAPLATRALAIAETSDDSRLRGARS